MTDFNMNTANVTDLGDNVGAQAKAYLEKVNEVTSIVTNLASIWGGPTYDTFKSTYDSNLANIEHLNTVLNEISNEILTTAENGEAMINEINRMMN